MGSDQSAVRSLLCHDLTADLSLPISVPVATGIYVCYGVDVPELLMHKLGNQLMQMSLLISLLN